MKNRTNEGWGTPIKAGKRGNWSKKQDTWGSFKDGSPKNPSSGPLAEGNIRGDQGYDKEVDTNDTIDKGEKPDWTNP